jgi:mono/diheme cytochrome c family protein
MRWSLTMAASTGLVAACSPRGTAPPPLLPAPAPTAAATQTQGAALYALHCASCHGERGEGQPDWKVPDADGLLPAPPHDSFGHTWHHPDAVLLQIIAQGGTLYSPVSNMPGYSDTLTADQMAQVLVHIKGLWGAEERTYQAEIDAEWAAANSGGAP